MTAQLTLADLQKAIEAARMTGSIGARFQSFGWPIVSIEHDPQ